jgi:ATPase family associated with various cellular activities (AAA)
MQKIEIAAGEATLPELALNVIRDAAARAKLHGLFEAGPARPGSGATVVFSGVGDEEKLVAAKALALMTGRSLYRVPTDQIVSKYIGETEKNLTQVLRKASDLDAILLFDEADSLFGKRSDVKDSHDRYANLSPDAFLQARKAFNGAVILVDSSQPPGGVPSEVGHEVRFPLLKHKE